MKKTDDLQNCILRVCELVKNRSDSQIEQDKMVAYWLMMGYDIGKASKKSTT